MEAISTNTVGFFTDNLLRQLGDYANEDNLAVSPIGLVTILAITLAGANGTTFSQLANVLNVKDDQESKLHRVFHSMINLMDTDDLTDEVTGPFSGYNVSVRSVALSSPPISQEYVDFIREMYSSRVEPLSPGDLSGLNERVNSWVSKSTKGRIGKMLDSPPHPNTRLVLVNSVSFEGEWRQPFTSTVRETFFNNGNDQVAADMMEAVKPIEHATVNGVKMVEVPYRGSASMIIAMPQANTANQLLTGGLSELIDQFDQAKQSDVVELTMPKFKITSSLDLLKNLASLGASDISSDRADLSRMTGGVRTSLYLQQLLHKTEVDVNEIGTSAASSTVASFVSRSILLPSQKITVNRPFVFIIRDNVAKTVLFTGKIVRV